jgi:ribonuclease P protein component
MLAQHLRLKRPQDFQRIRDQGGHLHGGLVSLNVLSNDLPHSRFGFVISRKVGNAVVRNRVKRRLRAAVRNRLNRLAGGYDIIVISHATAAAASYHELDARLADLFQRAGLLD